MSKRPSLFTSAGQTAPVEAATQQPLFETAPGPPKGKRPASREGKRVLSIYLKPEAWKQLRMMSLNMESSTQTLGEEAINLLFEKHRLNRIA
jgi:hypothetical protein